MRRLLLLTVGMVALMAAVLLVVRGRGISVHRTPSAIEERVARSAWRFLIPREVRDAANPVPNTHEVLRDGLEHFADHCAICHANNGSGDATIGRRIFPPAPDMRAPGTQSLTDGELFYAIEQGIPWTAMPGWRTGTPEGEQESWKLVRFIRHLPAVTPADLNDMERLNPRTPADDARDREIEEFLRGSKSATPNTKKGHTHK
ncbi:MAG TPA: cytochrome c [Vicinamibacterales bacterium]|nr:cytochrome c [Vicinamibacterales bacterium]